LEIQGRRVVKAAELKVLREEYLYNPGLKEKISRG